MRLTRTPRYHIIRVPKDFAIDGVKHPELPVVIDFNGYTHKTLNAYLRYRSIEQKINIKSTVLNSARAIVRYLNYLSVKEKIRYSIYHSEFIRSTNCRIRKYKNSLIGQKEPGTINQEISAIYYFLWYCNKNGYCRNLIGITDSDKGLGPFPVTVDPPKSVGKEFSIPSLKKVTKQQRNNIDNPEKWDKAYENAANSSQALEIRDSVIIRTIRETKLRRIAVANLTVSMFDESPEQHHSMPEYITIKVDKNNKVHDVPFNIDLFYDIKDYISDIRPLLVGKHKDDGSLFVGSTTGQGLSDNSFNAILKKYSLKPHDGRAIGITESFIELIKMGHDKNSSLLIVSQEIGHSLKSEGKTIEHYYLVAEQIVKGLNKDNTQDLKAELKKKDNEILNLRERLSRYEDLST